MKTIVITGGSRGIGAATAKACAERGMNVLLTYNKRSKAAKAIVREIKANGGSAQALCLDVEDVAAFAAFAAQVSTILAGTPLHGLVNNAGFGLYNPIDTVTPDQFDSLYAVHLKGPFFLTQALVPLMTPGSAVVNLTSATTRVATAGVAPYASFKGGLDVLTRYQAKEYGERRIRVNAVSPCAIRTELGGGLTPEFEAILSEQTALGRVGEPDEVGRVIAALLSDDLGWVNGQSIEVGGGYCL